MIRNSAFYKMFFLVFITCNFNIFAQPPGPSGGGLPPPPPDGPIDGHIIYVVLVSLLFGLYLVYHKIKTKKTPI
jgi:hypothetical protein